MSKIDYDKFRDDFMKTLKDKNSQIIKDNPVAEMDFHIAEIAALICASMLKDYEKLISESSPDSSSEAR